MHGSSGNPGPATTSAGPGHAVLRIASVNLQYGGLSEDGDDARWCKSVGALTDQDPHVVLVQEMTARPVRLQEHLWRTANELGMIPVLGPPSPDSFSGNHTAILVAARAGLVILDTGPPAVSPGSGPPAWCQALVGFPGIRHPVCFYSVHLPARSSVAQLLEAERLASRIAQRGELAVAGGDWNCYAPADMLTPATLASLPRHLRPPRMRAGVAGAWEANYDVHHALAAAGLTDAAGFLHPAQRDPRELTPTGIGGGRVDRFYVTGPLTGAIQRYEQRDTGGSDHQLLLLTVDLSATAVPPGPVP